MDPRLAAVNSLVTQTKKLTADWHTQKNLTAEQSLELQLAIGRLNEAICFLTTELGEMRTRTLK